MTREGANYNIVLMLHFTKREFFSLIVYANNFLTNGFLQKEHEKTWKIPKLMQNRLGFCEIKERIHFCIILRTNIANSIFVQRL